MQLEVITDIIYALLRMQASTFRRIGFYSISSIMASLWCELPWENVLHNQPWLPEPNLSRQHFNPFCTQTWPCGPFSGKLAEVRVVSWFQRNKNENTNMMKRLIWSRKHTYLVYKQISSQSPFFLKSKFNSFKILITIHSYELQCDDSINGYNVNWLKQGNISPSRT